MAWSCPTLGGAVDMRAQGGGRRYAQLHGVVGADEGDPGLQVRATTWLARYGFGLST